MAEVKKNIEKKEQKADTQQAASGKKKGKMRIWFYSLAITAALLILIYGGIAVYYQSHFLPGTSINQADCSNLRADEAALLVEQQEMDFQFQVLGISGAVLGTLTAQDIHYAPIDIKTGVQAILNQQNVLLWIKRLLGERASYDLVAGISFDEALLEEAVKGWDAFQKKNMTAPEDAYVGTYNGEGYEIVPESPGTELNIDAAIEAIQGAIFGGAQSVNLEEQGCYKEAAVTAENKKLKDTCAMMNTWVQTAITYDWNGNEVLLDKEQIHQWISIEKGEPKLDEEAVAEFVADNAKEFDTYGKKRKFTTALGTEVTLPSGAFGWKTDRETEKEELVQLIYQGSVLEKEPAYTVRGGAKGKNDIGSSYVEIDLSNQHLYLFKDGKIVLETDFVSGDMTRPGRMTPPGVFGLTYKTKNAVLRGDDYETPVNYWMPFNGNVGMHDATWRRNFGGDIFITNGSHGCVNLPLAKAEEIYEYVSTGFPVICYYY